VTAVAEAGATGGAGVPAPVLETRGLTRHFRIGGLRGRTLHAVDDLDLAIAEMEIVALVGESGSGKSTVARLLAMVFRPTAGEILFRGRPVSSLRRRRELLEYRGQVPMVFQDPFSSLNPAHSIGYHIVRGLKLHRPELGAHERRDEAERVLEAAGLVPPAAIMSKFPYELSGGQRQRVGFAQALSYRPKLVLADEPVSMLDVSIRIGLLNVMARLRDEEKVSVLYITHDIASARYVSDRVLVMYAGHLVEHGPTDEVLHHPLHPYTRLLLSAVPDPRAEVKVTSADVGEPPRVVDPGEGCRFRWRCPLATELCAQVTPRLRPGAPGHEAACHVTVPGPELAGAPAGGPAGAGR
jgi:peptide/nickel transport system ATP-binding protein